MSIKDEGHEVCIMFLPVLALGWKLLGVGELDGVGPTCRLSCQQLTLSSPSFHTRFRFLNAMCISYCMCVCVSFSSIFLSWCSRTWDWELSLTLQEGSVGVDEFVGWDIADGNTRHIGGIGGLCGWVKKRRWVDVVESLNR